MTHTPHSPDDALLGDLAESLVATIDDVLDVEPRARELERRLAGILGPRRGPAGEGWVRVTRHADGTVTFSIADVRPEDVFMLTRRMDALLESADRPVAGDESRITVRSGDAAIVHRHHVRGERRS